MSNNIRLILLIIFIFITHSVQAQSLARLDLKKGYYNLKLGDDISKWEPQSIQFISSGSETAYFYKGQDISDLYGHSVKKVILNFYNKKLSSIILDFGIWDAPEEGKYTNLDKSLDRLNDVIDILKSAYGSPSDVSNDTNAEKVAVYWEAKSKYILINLNYLGVRKGSRVTIEFGNTKSTVNSLIK